MDNNEYIALISRFLSKNKVISASFDEFEVFYENEFEPLLDKLKLPITASVIKAFDEIRTRAKIFLSLPFLFGKTVVTVAETASSDYYKLWHHLFPNNNGSFSEENSLPQLIYNGENIKETVCNKRGGFIDITEKELNAIRRMYFETHVDIKSVLDYRVTSIPDKYKDIVFLRVPFYAIKTETVYDLITAMSDAVIIPYDLKERWKKEADFAINKTACKNIFIIDRNGNDFYDIKMLAEQNKKSLTIGDLCIIIDWLANIVQPDCNFNYEYLIYKYICKCKVRIENELKIKKVLLKKLNSDNITYGDEMSPFFEDIYNKVKADLKAYEENICLFDEASEKLIKMFNEIQTCIFSFDPSKKERSDKEYLNELFELCIQFLENDLYKNKYIEYRNILKKNNFNLLYILDLYKTGNISSHSSAFPTFLLLKNSTSDSIAVKRAKVRFRDMLEIDKNTVYSLITSYEYADDLNADELMLLGDYYCDYAPRKAVKYLEKAVELGGDISSDTVKKLLNNADEKTVQKIITLGNKNVFAHLAKDLLHKNPNKSRIFGKMAASKGDTESILYFAHYYFSKGILDLTGNQFYDNIKFETLQHYQRKNIIDEKINQKISRGIEFLDASAALYEKISVSEKKQKSRNMLECGILDFWKGDHPGAIKKFKSCNLSAASYMLGMMYLNGIGCATDRKKALTQLRRAKKAGHQYAKVWVPKLEGEEESRKTHSSTDTVSDFSATSTEISRSENLCFITTAACLSLGKGQNSSELAAFYDYRDNHLIYDDDGYILIKEYYRIAPGIVRIIDSQKDAEKIYQSLFDDYIVGAYDCLKRNNFAEMKLRYITMVLELCFKYKIPLSDGFEKLADKYRLSHIYPKI